MFLALVRLSDNYQTGSGLSIENGHKRPQGKLQIG